jgi:hypothetical protein
MPAVQRQVSRNAEKDRIVGQVERAVLPNPDGEESGDAQSRQRHRAPRQHSGGDAELQRTDESRIGLQFRRQENAAGAPDRDEEECAGRAEDRLEIIAHHGRDPIERAQHGRADRRALQQGTRHQSQN